MSSRSLYRWAAVLLGVSGVSLAIGLILHPLPPYSESIATWQWIVSHLLWWIGALAGIAGLTGLYLRLREDAGLLGFIGVALALIGLALIGSAMYFEAFVAPSVASRAPELFAGFPAGGGWEGFLAGVLASGALFGLGFLLFAIAIFRAGSVQPWAILVALLGGIPFAVNFLLPRPVAIAAVAAFAVGLLGLGSTLWKSAELAGGSPVAPR